jgi:hypothetical protein
MFFKRHWFLAAGAAIAAVGAFVVRWYFGNFFYSVLQHYLAEKFNYKEAEMIASISSAITPAIIIGGLLWGFNKIAFMRARSALNVAHSTNQQQLLPPTVSPTGKGRSISPAKQTERPIPTAVQAPASISGEREAENETIGTASVFYNVDDNTFSIVKYGGMESAGIERPDWPAPGLVDT